MPLLVNSHNYMSDVPAAATWPLYVRLVIFCRISGVLLAFGLLALSTDRHKVWAHLYLAEEIALREQQTFTS